MVRTKSAMADTLGLLGSPGRKQTELNMHKGYLGGTVSGMGK